MLILTRRIGETVRVGEDIDVTVSDGWGQTSQLREVGQPAPELGGDKASRKY